MKKLVRRLGFYSIGLIVGIIFVLLVFGERACTWLPGNRVKEEIISKVIVFPEDQLEALEAMNVNEQTIYSIVVNGRINFKESIKDPTQYPKAYVFELTDSTGFKKVQFSLYEDSYLTVVHPLNDEESAGKYDHLEGWGKIVKLPKDSSLVYVDRSDYVQCKASPLKNAHPDQIASDLQKTGKINFSKSDLMLPKAEVQVHFQQGDLDITAETIWYKHRITFKDFLWEEKLSCEE